jgi:carbon monoxide dehydrogenase subunit G
MRFEERVQIGASPQRVWDLLTDWERQASWMPDVAWMRPLGPKRELGARFQVKTKVFGVPLATDLVEVTAWEPPRRLAIRHEGVVVGTGEWNLVSVQLEPAREATSFTWIESFHMRLPLIGGLTLRLYSPWQRWMLRRSMRNLKRLAESAAS